MNIYNLRYFVTLARIRQYTKAAEELCITQPSLSHAISQMEKELGVRLFEKNGHKYTIVDTEEYVNSANYLIDANLSNINWYILQKVKECWKQKAVVCFLSGKA